MCDLSNKLSRKAILKPLLALQYIDQFGPVKQSSLIAHVGGIENLLNIAVRDLARLGFNGRILQELSVFYKAPKLSIYWEQAEQALAWQEKNNIQVVLQQDDAFPLLLKELNDCPQLVFAKGNISLLNRPCVAIVGARKHSRAALDVTHHLASKLAEAGITVVSGMAMGIDTAAHQAALGKSGSTIAVWATGLDVVYPPQNEQLAEQLQISGCIVSEMNLGTPPLAGYFPRRNRLVSGISLGVLVIEADIKSGSLITARYALEQNREVFAVPGTIFNPLSRGCHHLIKQGAKLVESVDDILEELSLEAMAERSGNQTVPAKALANADRDLSTLTDTGRKVYLAIEYEPISFEALASRCQLSADEMNTALIDLELEGWIYTQSGFYTRK